MSNLESNSVVMTAGISRTIKTDDGDYLKLEVSVAVPIDFTDPAAEVLMEMVAEETGRKVTLPESDELSPKLCQQAVNALALKGYRSMVVQFRKLPQDIKFPAQL